jgi:hypothetical protein
VVDLSVDDILAGDTAFLRVTVEEVLPGGYCRISVQDDLNLMTTIGMAPLSEMAKRKDIDRLKPIRRAPTMWHVDR